MPGGGSVYVRSADNPDSLRGVPLDGLVFDECAFTDSYAWETSLRPTLADREGWTIFISTPNGHNWFYDEFQAAEAKWQEPTANNPLIPRGEIETAKSRLPNSVFAQEWLAEFVSETSSIFSPDWWQFYDRLPDERRVRRILQSWDTAFKTKKENDFSVCITAKEGGDGIYLARLFRARMEFHELKSVARELYETPSPSGSPRGLCLRAISFKN